jgi:hypothetical protein
VLVDVDRRRRRTESESARADIAGATDLATHS